MAAVLDASIRDAGAIDHSVTDCGLHEVFVGTSGTIYLIGSDRRNRSGAGEKGCRGKGSRVGPSEQEASANQNSNLKSNQAACVKGPSALELSVLLQRLV
jgi:hypothetical protein